jgi:hypothetical protein
MRYPACFDSEEQYLSWVHAARAAQFKINHCNDCTPQYQSRMIQQHRCEHPEVRFETDEDGFIIGTTSRRSKA